MKDILKTYQDRLINLSTSNRSLVLKKIYKKRSFDIFDLIDKKALVESQFLEHLFSDKKSKIAILKDPIKTRKQLIKDEKIKVEQQRKAEMELLKKKLVASGNLTDDEINVFKTKEKEINENYDELILQAEIKVKEHIETLVKYSNNINYLSREINAVEKETGKYELFIGYPFVEGKFNDGTVVRSPLMLIPVTIIFKNNDWFLKISDSDILINKVFLYGYSKYNNVTLDNFETNFGSFEQIGEDVKASIIDYFKQNKMVFEPSDSTSIIKFKDMRKDDFAVYENGQLVVKDYMILGQFPLSNSIYTDYEKMLEQSASNDLLEGLLINKTKSNINSSSVNLTEKDSYFYTGLDYSQEQAVKKLLGSKRLVIYGPPGTGKSYTISNIITDALCKGQRVLMVSKKKAALDVIYNKLSKVNGKIALIHDENKDKRFFYEKVKSSLEKDALLFDMNTKIKHDELSEKIESKLDELKIIEKTLMRDRQFGLSLQQMYIKTRAINDTEDSRFLLYRVFKNNEEHIKNFTYSRLSSVIDNIDKQEMICENYIKYRKFSDKNKFNKLIYKKFDLIQKQELIDIAGKIKSSISAAGNIDDLYSVFAKYYYENKSNFGDEKVMEFAKGYNDFLNGKLVEEHKIGLFDISGLIKKISSKEQRRKNKEKYEQELVKYEKLFSKIYSQIRYVQKDLTQFCNLIGDEFGKEVLKKFYEYYDISEDLDNIISVINLDEDDKLEFSKIDRLGEDENKILSLCYESTADIDGFKELKYRLKEFAILLKINEIESSKEFDEFFINFKKYLDTVDEIDALMTNKNNLTNDITKSVWNDLFSVYLDCADFKEFKRQANKKRMLWPIRKYIESFSELIFTLFPCWLLSPETVSDILPLKADMFDVIIFDEASQIFVEDAIPTIFRGKSIAIAGDDKQLKPTSIFSTKFDYFEEDKTDISNIAAFEEESLLDLAKVNYPSINLNYHYRSRYGSLINFSNYAFYGGTLNISPDIAYSKSMEHQPIEVIKVDGVWEDRKNVIEASKTVELIADILKNRKKEETIGVITFNVNQKDLIENLLDSKARIDEDFGKLYSAEKQRLDGNEDISIFVKNIENVQGDERDIIIFSVGYAKNPEGKVSINFGSLSQNGGENRLNVAISRAKRKIYIVSSIDAQELKVKDSLNAGPKLFKLYLQYAKAVSDNDEFTIKQVLKSLCENTKALDSIRDEFVEDLARELKDRGHKVVVDAGASRSKIDLAILNPETNNYILGIECDGKTYKSILSVRERDIHRKRFLEFRGWEIIRVWSRDWWKNREQVISKIEHFLSILIENERKTVVGIDYSQIVLQSKKNDKDSSKVGLGDTVFIKDMMTNDSFDVNIDDDENRLNEFKVAILNKSLNQIFEYKGFEYQVVRIKK